MPIIGTNFTKINVERTDKNTRNLKINNNLGILDINEMSLSVGATNQKGIKFKFEYTVKYEPNAASMLFQGEVLMLLEEKMVQDILKKWKDKKPIDEKVMAAVMNSALSKSAIQALDLSQDMNLPAPIKLPRVTQGDKNKQ